MKPSDKRQLESKLSADADRAIDKLHRNFTIEQNVIGKERVEAQQNRHETGRTSEEIDEEFRKKKQESIEKFEDDLIGVIQELADNSTETMIRTVETKKKERLKTEIEDGIRDHLRGFSCTIPLFLIEVFQHVYYAFEDFVL